MKFSPLVQMADQMMIYKYCIQQVAQIYGKTATFMPKPIYGDNGSGMHCHQSIWKAGKPVFAGNKYADLSETCLVLHRRHHQTRQGDQRLHQPDHQLLQAAGPGLRSAGAARLFGAQPLGVVPHSLHDQPEGQARRGAFPDPLANPYLAFAAMLMAGLDGVKNKLDPGSAIDKDLYDLPPAELKKIPTVCGSSPPGAWRTRQGSRVPESGRRVR